MKEPSPQQLHVHHTYARQHKTTPSMEFTKAEEVTYVPCWVRYKEIGKCTINEENKNKALELQEELAIQIEIVEISETNGSFNDIIENVNTINDTLNSLGLSKEISPSLDDLLPVNSSSDNQLTFEEIMSEM